MATDTTNISQTLVRMTWTCLSTSPESTTDYTYRALFPSQDSLAQLLLPLSITLSPGIFEMLGSDLPPTVSFFKSLPSGYDRVWAVYLLVLKKAGEQPLVYVGSATESLRGVRSRFQTYDRARDLPVYVEDALKKGFLITHKGLLCTSPIPSAVQVPTGRAVFIALETVFTFVLRAVRSTRSQYYHGMSSLCPWRIEDLDYGGLCSHNPLMELPSPDIDLNPEQLEKKAMKRKQASHEHYLRYKAEDPEGFRARARVSDAVFKLNNPEAVKAKYKRYHEKDAIEALETDRYRCEVCSHSFLKQSDLSRHLTTPSHATAVAPAERHGISKQQDFRCETCDYSFTQHCHLVNHLKTQKHADNEAFAKKGLSRLKPKFHCAVCDQGYMRKDGYNEHLKTKKHKDNVARAESGDSKRPKVHCDVCNHTFVRASQLEAHLATSLHARNVDRVQSGKKKIQETTPPERHFLTLYQIEALANVLIRTMGSPRRQEGRAELDHFVVQS